MHQSRDHFSLTVGLILPLIGATIATKSDIGFALVLMGLSIIGLTLLSRRQSNDMEYQHDMVLIPIPVDSRSNEHKEL